jgi:alpha-1,6-mannosyltransferase
VADVTQWYAPASGGIRTYLHAKAAFAERAGLDHALVVPGPVPGEERLHASRVVRLRGRTPSGRWGYRLVPRPGPLVDALDRLAPDVVVLHDVLSFPHAVARWARARGAALTMLCHSDLGLATVSLPGPARRPATAALRAVQRRGLRAPESLLVASRASYARIEPLTGVPVSVSPLGVDLGAFAGAVPDPGLRAGLSGGAPLLVSVGRLSGEKRVDLLPDMLAALGGDAVLALAGTGAAEAALRRRAVRLGVAGRLRPLGHVADRARLAALLATADCLVHPNPAEPYGLAPLEALAAGCRVVAPDAAGTREVLGGRGAVLVAPGDPRALAAGVRRALTLPRPRPDLSDLAWERTFAREWDHYRALLGTRRAAA